MKETLRMAGIMGLSLLLAATIPAALFALRYALGGCFGVEWIDQEFLKAAACIW